MKTKIYVLAFTLIFTSCNEHKKQGMNASIEKKQKITDVNNLSKAENELINIYRDNKDSQDFRYDEDSMPIYEFGNALTKLLLSNPATMSYPFRQIVDSGYAYGYVHISTSKDGNLRLYSWETPFGGTSLNYGNVYQYKSNDTVHTVKGTPFDIEKEKDIAFDYGTDFDSIYIVKLNEKTCYVVENNNRIGTSDYINYVTAFIIENDQLKKTAIFKTPKGLLSGFQFECYRCESELGFSYNKEKNY